eukprot:1157235-Pelagomonas_calceolata.AAC.4
MEVPQCPVIVQSNCKSGYDAKPCSHGDLEPAMISNERDFNGLGQLRWPDLSPRITGMQTYLFKRTKMGFWEGMGNGNISDQGKSDLKPRDDRDVHLSDQGNESDKRRPELVE